MPAMRRALPVAAGGGGVVLLVALWLPWFHRKLSAVFAPVRAVEAVSGWRSLGTGLGAVIAAVAVGAVLWGAVSARWSLLSGTWLVLPGGLALLAEVATTVARVGADTAHDVVTTTTPAPGLALAYAGAVAVVLAGLGALLRQVMTRT